MGRLVSGSTNRKVVSGPNSASAVMGARTARGRNARRIRMGKAFPPGLNPNRYWPILYAEISFGKRSMTAPVKTATDSVKARLKQEIALNREFVDEREALFLSITWTWLCIEKAGRAFFSAHGTTDAQF